MNDRTFEPGGSPIGDERPVASEVEGINPAPPQHEPKPGLVFIVPAPPQLGKTRWRLSSDFDT